jgi:hypothetical protein
MQCFEPKIETATSVANNDSLQYTCTGRLVRPEGFEEYVTTLTFKQEGIDSSFLPHKNSVISLCTDFDPDAVERPVGLDKCYLLQMKVCNFCAMAAQPPTAHTYTAPPPPRPAPPRPAPPRPPLCPASPRPIPAPSQPFSAFCFDVCEEIKW